MSMQKTWMSTRYCRNPGPEQSDNGQYNIHENMLMMMIVLENQDPRMLHNFLAHHGKCSQHPELCLNPSLSSL